MKCPNCGKEVESLDYRHRCEGKKPERFEIHENEGGPPPAIPRGMPVAEEKKKMTPAQKQKAFPERRKEKKK